MPLIRPCHKEELNTVVTIINAAAERYRGVIPADRWQAPYLSVEELRSEIAQGVSFWGCERGEDLVGVMGLQPVQDVWLIRHAYVLPADQGGGVGRALLEHLRALCTGRILVGTWAAASWAIRFYERNGFRRVPPQAAGTLLRRYWSIPTRQVETSVVLTNEREIANR
jgi:GNAT superfamily N-acetyltransferase